MTDIGGGAMPRGLRADGLIDPVGGTRRSPRLSWKLDGRESTGRFRVVAASSEEVVRRHHGDVFDCTTVDPWLDWPVAPLASRSRVWWSVASIERDGAETWSSPSVVEAPLWHADDWVARPITHSAWVSPGNDRPAALPELRTRLVAPSGAVRARLYLTGAGIVVPEINGTRLITGELEPGYSDLAQTTMATAWDVPLDLLSGESVFGLKLFSGIAYLPAGERYSKFTRTGEPVWAQAQLEFTRVDGVRTVLGTGPQWEARLGPVTESHWYGGESRVDGHGGEWEPATCIDVPSHPRWRSAPPIAVVETRASASVKHHEDGSRIFDLATNLAGRPRLTLAHARPGEPIEIRPSELLDAHGGVDQATTGSPIWDSLVPATTTAEWAPEGVYHGARYLEVRGLTAAEPDDAVTFEVMRATNEVVGSFETSDAFLAQLHTNIDRAVQGNMFSVFTDCPHREKLGWLEQLHYCFSALARGYDVQAHLEDAVRHMMEAQTPSGLVPNIAPELVEFNSLAVLGDIEAFRSDPNWGRAIIEVPWLLYEHYGDARIVRESLAAAQRYLDYLDERSVDGLLDFGLGDWIEIEATATPRALLATHGWWEALRTAARSARVAGQADVSDRWGSKATVVRAALLRNFWNSETGVWGSGSQGSWAIGWSLCGEDADARRHAVRGLMEAIRRDGDALTVGENSLPYLIRALAESGYSDFLSELIRKVDAPGYGHQIASGATALTESWRGSGGTEGVISQNHFMLGAIDDWILGDVAGLRQAPGSVGWKKVLVRPHCLLNVDFAQTSFDSPRGLMQVAWRRTRTGEVHVAVDVPVGVRVEIDLPPRSILRTSIDELCDEHEPVR